MSRWEPMRLVRMKHGVKQDDIDAVMANLARTTSIILPPEIEMTIVYPREPRPFRARTALGFGLLAA